MNKWGSFVASACLLVGGVFASASEEARGTVIAASTPFATIVHYHTITDVQVRLRETTWPKSVDAVVAFSRDEIRYELRLRKNEAGPRGGRCELYKLGVAGWPELFMSCGPPHYFGTLSMNGDLQPQFSVNARIENGAIIVQLLESKEPFRSFWLEPKLLYDARARDSEYVFYSEGDLLRPKADGITDAIPVWYRHEPRLLQQDLARQVGPGAAEGLGLRMPPRP